MIFSGYNPYGPHSPKTASATDVPLQQFKAAQAAGATHLSADGKTAYDQRQYGLWYCSWDESPGRFGSWYKILDSELPANAVIIERTEKL